MPQKDLSLTQSAAAAPARRPWTAPRVDDMPRLTDLTLQSDGIPADCDDSNPSSCFG
jgi:hypothetical protein